MRILRGRATVMGARHHDATGPMDREGGDGRNPQPGDLGGFHVDRSFARRACDYTVLSPFPMEQHPVFDTPPRTLLRRFPWFSTAYTERGLSVSWYYWR